MNETCHILFPDSQTIGWFADWHFEYNKYPV
jgi:hypothetical protein